MSITNIYFVIFTKFSTVFCEYPFMTASFLFFSFLLILIFLHKNPIRKILLQTLQTLTVTE